MALLSALAKRLVRSRLVAMSRVSSLPFYDAEEAVPLLAMRGARTGIESNVDPRLILVGGALGMFPMGALTAKALREYEPWEDQFQYENARWREMEAMNDELWEMRRRLWQGEVRKIERTEIQ